MALTIGLPRLSVAIFFLLNWILPAMAISNSNSEFHFNITTVPGYFMQDEKDTDPDTFDYVKSNFGLIRRQYDSDSELNNQESTQWQRFEHHIQQLNRKSSEDIGYRLLFLGRHGEGYHNVAEAEFGTEAWDCYWSLQPGNGTITWLDAHLTPTGIQQAQTAHNAWKTQIKNKIPAPQSYYVSPLNRCLSTAKVTFGGLGLPRTEPFRPVVKELLRETIGLHTCDKRSPKSTIEEEYPLYRIEPSFTNQDELWTVNQRESNTARDARLRDLLQDIFRQDENTVLSLTAHSGAITSLLNVMGHRVFPLATGGVIPVFVRVEKVGGGLPELRVDPPEGKPDCSADSSKGGVVERAVEVKAEV